MKAFAALFAALDATTSTAARTGALAAYFTTAPGPDRVWTVALLSGRRPRRAATGTELRQWAASLAGLPDWLFTESYALTGDLAETIALILPPARPGADVPGLAETLAGLSRLAGQPADTRRSAIEAAWAHLPPEERFLFTKLLTGGFRMGVSRGLMTRALSQATGLDEAQLAHRLMGDWDPATTRFEALISGLSGRAGGVVEGTGNPGAGATPGPIPSPLPHRWRPRRRTWAILPTGGRNGNGTASAASWSPGPGPLPCGPGARNW